MRVHATYSHEYPRRLRLAVVGCGEQFLRNVLPALRFAPAEIVALCDVDAKRCSSLAAALGVPHVFTAPEDLARSGLAEGVILCSGYDADGRPAHARQALVFLAAGLHVWAEKPPAATTSEIEAVWASATEAKRSVAFGFMKMFSPAVRQIIALIKRPEFGPVTSVYLRDPEELPAARSSLPPDRLRWLVDHVVHSASMLLAVAGAAARLSVERASNGAAVVSIRFRSGAVGSFHMPWGQSSLSPKERLEVVGTGENAVLEGSTRLSLYRAGAVGRGSYVYGRVTDFLSEPEIAPLRWEMETYSGEPYNMHSFYQGYAQCLISFCDAVLNGHPVSTGGLADAWLITQFYEGLLEVQDGGGLELPPPPSWIAG